MSKMNRRNDEYRDVALKVLIEIGAIKTCPIHQGEFYYQTGMESSTIYAFATNKLKEKYPQFSANDLFRDRINEILGETFVDNECPYCKKAQKSK